MSDYCKNCTYDLKQRTEKKACPFNFFYWDFLSRHQEQLKSIGRMNLVLGNLKRMTAGELSEINALAADWREKNK